MSSIVLTGGGTAGHCIPHLAIIPHIHSLFDNICYIGSKNGIEKQIMSKYCDYYEISTVKLKRSLSPKNLLIPFKLLKAKQEAKRILQKLDCKLVFSKGGYVSLPVVLAAHSLKIPIIAHESDFTMGLANKLSAKKCSVILTTFEQTALSIPNGIFTGPPIREELFFADKRKAKKKFGFDNTKPVLLVMGGSSGSKKINECFCTVLPYLLSKFYVLHLCGNDSSCNGVSYYGYYRLDYTNDMASVYAASDFAISRCGSNSACELIALKIPTLFIPLSKAESRGDQIQNAEYFKSKHLCHVLTEECLNTKNLTSSINKLEESALNLKQNLNNYKERFGNEQIAKIITEYSLFKNI